MHGGTGLALRLKSYLRDSVDSLAELLSQLALDRDVAELSQGVVLRVEGDVQEVLDLAADLIVVASGADDLVGGEHQRVGAGGVLGPRCRPRAAVPVQGRVHVRETRSVGTDDDEMQLLVVHADVVEQRLTRRVGGGEAQGAAFPRRAGRAHRAERVSVLGERQPRRHRSGLLRDVTQVLLNERINVLAVNTRSNKEDNTASMSITVEIPGLDALGRLLARIGQLPNIIEARRHRVS